MEFATAVITPVKPSGPDIPVLFNPNQYTFAKSVNLAEMEVPGLGAPILQYVRGNARTLTMDLFFDTFEAGKDVRDYTNQIYALLNVEAQTHVPALCKFKWGGGQWGKFDQNSFRCVIENVTGRFTLFREDGTPVRATLTVTMREAADVQLAVRNPPTQSADHVTTRVVRRGDTLMSIAAAEYGDPANWRPIAVTNRLANPRLLTAGQVLVIPALDRRGEAK